MGRDDSTRHEGIEGTLCSKGLTTSVSKWPAYLQKILASEYPGRDYLEVFILSAGRWATYQHDASMEIKREDVIFFRHVGVAKTHPAVATAMAEHRAVTLPQDLRRGAACSTPIAQRSTSAVLEIPCSPLEETSGVSWAAAQEKKRKKRASTSGSEPELLAPTVSDFNVTLDKQADSTLKPVAASSKPSPKKARGRPAQWPNTRSFNQVKREIDEVKRLIGLRHTLAAAQATVIGHPIPATTWVDNLRWLEVADPSTLETYATTKGEQSWTGFRLLAKLDQERARQQIGAQEAGAQEEEKKHSL
ncbi:hypothetical protein CALCODRAFT_485281 [Calocera cornea HHB12733]|uniref:Uncharacterized protein n=1 Tax=Calocera cornea HHB12733 TaxID=1353952 RepID=A0A165EES1_9BASI|nr:hypothetical protein CALCODRAFT_485281 [Calocera cornea HHB12733]